MPRTDIIIAIDPDVERSGVAVLHTHTRHIRLSTSPFPDLVEYLQGIRESDQITGTNTLVVVEAGWLNKPNWHLTAKDSPRIAAAKGNAAGRNHETGRKIVEMARHYGLAVKEAKPLRKCWRGKDGKITHGHPARTPATPPGSRWCIPICRGWKEMEKKIITFSLEFMEFGCIFASYFAKV